MAAVSALVGLLLLVSVETGPSPLNQQQQVFLSLFGSRLASLIEATPSPDDITDGSASSPLLLSRHGNVSGSASRQEVVPRLFLDFLRRRAKTRRRSHTAGGRGCFGMKLDRIGSISGLGC
ncbi:C-type natriuretic peptide 2-like [Poeciliopsis prolifica]|uniref:C-type natriuretic peptide 2-like n=1 Tax=Poeciliopsis prolifica TaxID=188132 RepID=UPI002413F591|nr:C-type natriuretic peptide 2-like [Poeciliopsis prolifica]XP_054912176.1 C-type natriuretic peptide 2-like [Poeciliopsis prolifica]